MSAKRSARSPHRWRAPVVEPAQPGREPCPECGRAVPADALAEHVERVHGRRLAAAFETMAWLDGTREVDR